MCGRFALYTGAEELARLFLLMATPPLEPRYNLAPSQNIAALRANRGQREMVLLRWGLIPHWMKAPPKRALINARAETLQDRPAFRDAYRHRRCLIPADGFFEWQRSDGRAKPYYISPQGGGPLLLAGLWEVWDEGPAAIQSCSIITRPAQAPVDALHERMPVIIPPEAIDTWLCRDTTTLEPLLLGKTKAQLRVYPVSPKVNNARYDTAELIEPLPDLFQA